MSNNCHIPMSSFRVPHVKARNEIALLATRQAFSRLGGSLDVAQSLRTATCSEGADVR
jgi:hypothetical protein